jgi:hypothetical protein
MESNRTDNRQWVAIGTISGALAMIVLGLFFFLLLNPRQPIPVQVTIGEFPPATPIAESGGSKFFGGWVDDANAREAVVQSLPAGQRYFSDTPAFKAFRGDDTKDVLLTDAAVMVTGKWLPIRDQADVGSCVSFGTATAIEHLILLQIAEAMRAGLPPPSEYRDLAQEVIYGGSRVEVGGGRIRGDGSVTAWAGEFVKRWGVVPRDQYGSIDLRKYSTRTCREFGARGVPDALEVVARQSPVKGITFVRNAIEADRAIRQGYPIAVGSQIGFGSRGPWPRDQDGFLRASGSWGHCMAVLGTVTVGQRKGFLFINSWSESVHQGPTGGKNIPAGGCFFVDWSTANRMFGEGDAIAFSDAVGFPTRSQFDWFINVAPKPDVFTNRKPRKGEEVAWVPSLAW